MIALGIVIATVAAFVISAVYYGVMPATPSSTPVPQRPIVAQMLVELLRNLAVAGLAAGLLAAGDWSGVGAGALLGLSLWALPVVLLAGSVVHEGVPLRSAAPHAVDWLAKLIAIGAILGLFV
jgi:hypothetical protein